jgi:hypothetical protein
MRAGGAVDLLRLYLCASRRCQDRQTRVGSDRGGNGVDIREYQGHPGGRRRRATPTRSRMPACGRAIAIGYNPEGIAVIGIIDIHVWRSEPGKVHLHAEKEI